VVSMLTRILVVAIATTALAVSPASALPLPPDRTDNTPAPVVVTAPDRPASSGFDLGDAAIGAGGLLALLTLGGSGTLAIRRMRAASSART
jgi:hypothetical protein